MDNDLDLNYFKRKLIMQKLEQSLALRKNLKSKGYEL